MAASEDGADFSAACAFVGLHLVSRLAAVPEFDYRETVLLGSAQLLGLLIERAWIRRDTLEENLRRAESQVAEMRLQRTEDAKANDKVVCIFASHEQSWIADRKRLKNQIRILVNELRAIKTEREEAKKKREELEEKLRMTNSALADLTSRRHDLEAEIGLALRQAEDAKQELVEAVSLADKLSAEIAKMQKDTEQKDKILSAMLRKSKLDSTDKESLQKEAKMAKAKQKQAELETDRWRNKWESRHNSDARLDIRSNCTGYGYNNRTLLLEHLGQEWQKEHESMDENTVLTATNRIQDAVTADIEHLQNWVQFEIQKQTSILEQRHYKEVEAFIEQMRLKDEKLASAHWRILSTKVGSKRLHSRIDALDDNLSHMRAENLKLEALLLDREVKIKSLKERLGTYVPPESYSGKNEALRSEMKQREKKSREKVHAARAFHDIVTVSSIDSEATALACQRVRINEISESLESSSEEQEKSITLLTIYPTREIEEEKEVTVESGYAKSALVQSPLMRKDSSGKMDIHALGVAYKIKRLKQQLLVLEKVAGIDHNDVGLCDIDGSGDHKRQPKALAQVISLLNKQVKRFQSLEERTDDLCTRMNANSRASGDRDSRNGKTKDQRKILQNFLEETFQLQRYMVATGQKLVDIQSKISISFGSEHGLDRSAGFNIDQFTDVIRTLFKEIQRGLELRIARIIGDIEGTLACNGILHM